MKESELRIGNILHFPFSDEIVEVLGLNAYENKDEPNGIGHLISFRKDNSLYCEPIQLLSAIPLTEEWFSKFGYNDVNMPNHFVKDEATIDEHRFWDCNGMFIDDKNGVRIKYVHQLQNLYFALYGEELTIKKSTE